VFIQPHHCTTTTTTQTPHAFSLLLLHTSTTRTYILINAGPFTTSSNLAQQVLLYCRHTRHPSSLTIADISLPKRLFNQCWSESAVSLGAGHWTTNTLATRYAYKLLSPPLYYHTDPAPLGRYGDSQMHHCLSASLHSRRLKPLAVCQNSISCLLFLNSSPVLHTFIHTAHVVVFGNSTMCCISKMQLNR